MKYIIAILFSSFVYATTKVVLCYTIPDLTIFVAYVAGGISGIVNVAIVAE